MNRKHVLIVEDDDDVRSCYQTILEDDGYGVYSAIHGKDALDQLSVMSPEELPGCIFLDLKMPVMDGQTFLKTIVKGKYISLRHIPIVVVSANGWLYKNDLSPAVEKLDKPLDIDDIYRVAHRYCGDPGKMSLH